MVAVAARTISEVSSLDRILRARAEDRRISTLTLDSEIRFASPESRAAFAAELTDRIAELVAKYHDDQSPRGRRFRLVTIGHPHPDLPPSAGAASSPPASDVRHQSKESRMATLPATRDKKRRSFTMSIDIDATPEEVWRALTDAGELMRWSSLQARVTPGKGGSVFWGWDEHWAWESQIDAWEPERRC